MDQYFERIEKILLQKKVPPRVCFMLQDVLEFRQNVWVPKTLNQINIQARQEEMKEKILLMQQPGQQRGGTPSMQYGNRKRSSGTKDRDMQSLGGKVPPRDKSWAVPTGKRKSLAVDASKFTQISKV